MFALLHFPIYSLNFYPFMLFLNKNSNIIIHTHKFVITTIKFTNFLSSMINYKLKFYNAKSTKASMLIKLVNKSNKKQRIQKGLGKARLGSLKSSICRGGGVLFGPRPKFFNLKINTKEWTYIYKSIILHKRSCLLWFFINKTVYNMENKNFIQILIHHLGISNMEKIKFIILDKYILSTQGDRHISIYNIKLLDLFNTKYIIYLI